MGRCLDPGAGPADMGFAWNTNSQSKLGSPVSKRFNADFGNPLCVVFHILHRLDTTLQQRTTCLRLSKLAVTQAYTPTPNERHREPEGFCRGCAKFFKDFLLFHQSYVLHTFHAKTHSSQPHHTHFLTRVPRDLVLCTGIFGRTCTCPSIYLWPRPHPTTN